MSIDTGKTNSGEERGAQTGASDWGIFVVRIVLGFIFFMHGSQKVFGWFGGHGLTATATGMSTMMGIPEWLIYVSIFTEFIGGIFMFFGFLSRIVGIGLIVNMIVAIAEVHGKNGFFIGGNPKGPGFEYNIGLIAMALAIVVAGPGAAGIVDLEGRVFRLGRK